MSYFKVKKIIVEKSRVLNFIVTKTNSSKNVLIKKKTKYIPRAFLRTVIFVIKIYNGKGEPLQW